MNRIRTLCIAVLVGSLVACATPRSPAPVVDRAPAPIGPTDAGGPRVEAGGNYIVRRGDTLYRIALAFNQNFRDLVVWNNLDSANDIKVGQVLRVLPPQTSASGAQTGTIASGSGIEVRPLSSAPNKSVPSGDKKPFSDRTLAEMQKPDGVPGPAASATGTNAATPDAANPSVVSGIQWMWPAEGKIVGTFAQGKKGIDIAGALGQPIVAAGAGTVLYASSVRGYGNLVIVKHNNNLLSAYAHNKTILVKEGQTVERGQKISEMGNSDTDSVKLHFEIRQQGKPVDPSKFLPTR